MTETAPGFSLYRFVPTASSVPIALDDIARAAEERAAGPVPDPQFLTLQLEAGRGFLTFACGMHAVALGANRETTLTVFKNNPLYARRWFGR